MSGPKAAPREAEKQSKRKVARREADYLSKRKGDTKIGKSTVRKEVGTMSGRL